MNNPKGLSFNGFQTLLRQSGWTFYSRKGSRRNVAMKRADRFDGYSVNIFLDDDGEYFAHFVEMPNISAFGDSPEQALQELEADWEGVKEGLERHGEPVPIVPSRKEYSGQFNVRVDRRLHRALAMEAARAGVSLNAIASQKLAKETSAAPKF